MTEKTQGDVSLTGQRERASRFSALATHLGTIIGNHIGHLWFSGGDARSSVNQCHALLAGILNETSEIFIRRVGGQLELDNVKVPLGSAELTALADQLEGLKVGGIVISRGISEKELGDLLEILSARSEELAALGGFAAFLRRVGIEHVTHRQIILREVTEEEVVVKKDNSPAALSPAEKERRRNEMVSYLQSGATADEDRLRQELTEAREDANAMADLIVESARAPELDSDDVVSVERVREALQRAFDLWVNAPGMKTQKAKKDLSRAIRRLKGQVLDRLGKLPGFDDDAQSLITDAFEGVDDELKMDSLAAEYLSKRKAVNDSESRILRYVRKKGRAGIAETDLSARLMEGGLDGGDWRDLLIRSGVAGSSAGEEGAVAAMQQLSSRLSRIEDALRKKDHGKGTSGTETDVRQLAGELKDVAADVDAAVLGTNRRIADMVEGYQDDEEPGIAEPGAVEGSKDRKRRMTRQQLYETLSEISQELCQPLSVINCSLSMIRSGRLGNVEEVQGDMLNLATDSAQRLKDIADSLMDITGVPLALEPDAEIRSEIYDRDA